MSVMPFMPFTLFRFLLPGHGSKDGVRAKQRRPRPTLIDIEMLEQRMALTVSTPSFTPSIALTAASDTGARGDGITRLPRPSFAGAAPARSSVVVYADGSQLLGVVRANALGRWSLASQPLTSGAHAITAQAYTGNVLRGTSSPLSLTIDRTPPTATVNYDATNGIVTLTFSEAVWGVGPANVRVSGRTTEGVVIPNTALNNPRLRPYVGAITFTVSPDRTSYTFREQLTLAEPGTYAISLAVAGIVDLVGNPAATPAPTRFTIL